MDLGKLGVFCFLDGLNGPQVTQFAQKVERLGYSALWFAETVGRKCFTLAAHLLSHTDTLEYCPQRTDLRGFCSSLT